MKIRNCLCAAKTVSRLVLLSAAFTSCVSGYAAAEPQISAYFLSGPEAKGGTPDYYATLDNLRALSEKIATQRSNFNYLMLSFVQPSLTKYTSGSLACTGLFGYTCVAGKDSSKRTLEQAKTDFKTLKEILAGLKAHGVKTYIAVGGWNFSCNPKIYDKTAKKDNACGPADAVYDTFPNPLSENLPRKEFESSITGAAADGAYKNVVQLAHDLGAAGIDVDYEEFWHADINAKYWTLTPDAEAVKNPPPNPKDTNDPRHYQQVSDAELMQLGGVVGGSSEDVYDKDGKLVVKSPVFPRAMPLTVAKFAAILKSLQTAISDTNPSLKLSVAAPTTGAIPNMSANWGTVAQNSGIYGGAWWGGNLYGLIYNAALLHKEQIDKLSHVGIMSYDLSEKDCEGKKTDGYSQDSGIPCDLVGQANFYYNTFASWLKTGSGLPECSKPDDKTCSTSNVKVKGSRTYAEASIQPRKLLIAPPVTVGFEVGQPATGNLVLTKADLTKILDETVKYGQSGIIMWDLYKNVRYDQKNWKEETWATPKEVLQKACTKMGLAGVYYKCDADIP